MLLCHDTMVISRSFGSFRVALRSEPIDAPASLQPLINFSLALKRFDVPNFDSGVVSLDLPVVFCNSVVLEGNPRRFAHGGQYGVLWRRPPAPDQSRSCLIAEPGACGRDNRKAASERKSKRAQNGQRGARAGRRRDSPRIFLRRIFLRCVISATTGFYPLRQHLFMCRRMARCQRLSQYQWRRSLGLLLIAYAPPYHRRLGLGTGGGACYGTMEIRNCARARDDAAGGSVSY
jgi:hypothetical protein